MKPVCSFFTKFASLIAWVLSCFDRVIFKGHLPISRAAEFERFVDYTLKIRRADFLDTVGPKWSKRLVEHSKQVAHQAGRPWEYHAGDIDKDAWAKEQLARSPVVAGLVGVLCVMEACPTFKLKPGEKRPGFVARKVPQRVLYYYFVDKELGLMHVRLQTWAPFTCQVYANGHDYVARQLHKKGIAFEQVANAFVQLGAAAAAQRCADRFAKLPWPKILERYARRVNPLLQTELKGLSHYWVIDQAEYATDVRFARKHALAGLFGRLLAFALLTFSPKKIFTYLGRRLHERFDGEVQTHYKSVREPGACIKHFMKRNWLKMYDKLGLLLLRVETVINQPGEFKVLRARRHRDGTTTLGWFAMCKGVGNLPHYQSHALACNHRYLAVLAAVDDPTPGYDDLKKLTEPQRHQGRSYAGFNPAREGEVRLFAAVLAGDHIAQGFRNQDIRAALYTESAKDPLRHRHSAAVGRLLKRLQVRGLVVKVPRSRRWRVTDQGRRVMADTLQTYRRYQTQAA
ncbi:MAG: hypothetical protein JNM56_17100 [Planctomycetia bacterium]|nr:hypothetical protein [Planctomycetia bacterium]